MLIYLIIATIALLVIGAVIYREHRKDQKLEQDEYPESLIFEEFGDAGGCCGFCGGRLALGSLCCSQRLGAKWDELEEAFELVDQLKKRSNHG